MSRIAVFRSLAVALGTVSMVAACGGGNQPSENLASDQTLSFPMVDDDELPGKVVVEPALSSRDQAVLGKVLGTIR